MSKQHILQYQHFRIICAKNYTKTSGQINEIFIDEQMSVYLWKYLIY